MFSRIFSYLADVLIVTAMRTPYAHLVGYMDRWWLVPYAEAGTGHGTGPVSAWRRPLAWVLQRLGVAVRVHEIMRSDNDRAFHDHPWSYLTVILGGGYWEIRPMPFKTWDGTIVEVEQWTWHGPGSVLFRRASHFHRLVLPEGAKTTTLFITFRWQQVWGFRSANGGKVDHRTYLGGQGGGLGGGKRVAQHYDELPGGMRGRS